MKTEQLVLTNCSYFHCWYSAISSAFGSQGQRYSEIFTCPCSQPLCCLFSHEKEKKGLGLAGDTWNPSKHFALWLHQGQHRYVCTYKVFRVKFASCPCYLTADVPAGGQAVVPGVKAQVHPCLIVKSTEISSFETQFDMNTVSVMHRQITKHE